ncbi:MAG: hypothetical protein WCL07_03125 [bacterium]
MSSKQLTFRLPIAPDELVEDYSARTYYFITTILGLLSVAFSGVLWSNLPKQIPLLLTYPWGEGRLAPRSYIFVIPALIFVVTILNIIVGKFLRSYPIILVRILAIASMLVAVMLDLALIGILQSIL